MKKISLFALLFGVAYLSSVSAAVVSGAEFAKWVKGSNADLPGFARCKGSATDIGIENKDTGKNSSWQDHLYNYLYDKEWSKGALFYIAHEVAENGYKFCKTYVSADRSDCYGQPYTEYWYSKSLTEKPDCFWLCKPGFFDDGTGCNSKVMTDTTVPDVSKIAKFNHASPFAQESGFRYKNVQDNIQMLYTKRAHRCDSDGSLQVLFRKTGEGEEHDIVLAIKSITEGVDEKTSKGNGIVTYSVQPLVIRAGGTAGCLGKTASHTAWALPYFDDKQENITIDTSMCPGNMMHADGGGCYVKQESKAAAAQTETEQINYKTALTRAQSLEEAGLAILCQGFDRAKYDNKVHVLNSKAFEYQNWRIVGETKYNVSKEDVLGTSIGTKEEYIGAKDKNEYVNTKCANDPSRTACEQRHAQQYDELSKEYDEKKAAASEAYDNAQINENVNATCTVFVCKDEGMGYASDPTASADGDFTCVSCAVNSDKTIHHSRLGRGSDGICKVCNVGEIVKNGQCEKSKSIHKFYMDGMNQKTSGEIKPVENLADQCWTKPTPDEYKACIKDLGLENSGGE